MFLQRLEIAGFKSFPDRSELKFDRGVTAIVGPNGCGKSNVVDAITWVLGEQSARSLRGERMEDVIFGGSEARKPTGAAEVRLALSGVAARRAAVAASVVTVGGVPDLDDLDLEPSIVRDVEVSRRLYRSGESEYLIDGEVCRLRDVQDLLMDAGLGVKAYAVIEQGKIGQILSARPTDRRQLIEEAAGVTKYKTRRRAAELKLEAALQNLTRVDDIVFELEKQRGALKRQASKARRHQRLREALRHWEQILFAERYATLAAAIEQARARLDETRITEAGAAGRVAALEAYLEQLRLTLAEAEGRATEARETAHAKELAIERRQQQLAFERQQVTTLEHAVRDLLVEVDRLAERREPARLEIDARRGAASRVARERDEAADAFGAADQDQARAARDIEGLEGDVEAARSEVFAAMNAATTLRHAIEHADEACERISADLARFDIEAADVRTEAERAERERMAATSALATAQAALRQLQDARSDRDVLLANARINRERQSRELRAREQDLASIEGRLRSLEQLDAARAGYGDAARSILAEPDNPVGHVGSVADYLEVDRTHERAVEAWLGDLLEYVIVPTRHAADAGLQFVRERAVGRCGFLIADGAVGLSGAGIPAGLSDLDGGGVPAGLPTPAGEPQAVTPDGLQSLRQIVRMRGPFEAAIRSALGEAWLASSFDEAASAATSTDAPVVTPSGEVFRGPRLVHGGNRNEARGILGIKREIKELRDRVGDERVRLQVLTAETSAFESVISQMEAAIGDLTASQHQQEKAIVGLELQMARARDDGDRVARRQELIAAERRRAQEERTAQELRAAEARSSIDAIEISQRAADERLTGAQRRLLGARETLETLSRRTGEAKAAHAALVERASALSTEIDRLEEGARELDARIEGRRDEHGRTITRQEALRASIASLQQALDEDAVAFDALRGAVRDADERVTGIHADTVQRETAIRDARRALDEVRARVNQLEIARATAEADLTHLAASCIDTLQATLDEVAADVAVAKMAELAAAEGAPGVPDDYSDDADDGDAADDDAVDVMASPAVSPSTAEEAIAGLRKKIERLGPVNMMAIEQFDELEARHAFLTTQRKDLLDSIAATGEAIRRIERTTRERFQEAFTVINRNFEQTFTTLFGGGRAGLILLDEGDLLESGIDIIAQPPGKRLQNVQLLSGGEKALTAMALMFAIFQYRPSPFCLLDEIDAPLDDANIGRFVEMLRGMQMHTQFILITHNRKTMEIADRLYGITMEEPGVSKLISVQLN